MQEEARGQLGPSSRGKLDEHITVRVIVSLELKNKKSIQRVKQTPLLKPL